jgi:hypothetical protein
MKLKLSEYGITNIINELEYLTDTLTTTSGLIVDKLVDAGVAKATELNAAAPRSGTSENNIYGEYSKKDEGGRVVMQGKDAVFDEFGTGEEGASDPHPLAGVIEFSMPPYSGYITGPVVSKNINPETGRHFWYYRPMAGRPYFNQDGYTEGIPSGKQMYNTLQFLRKEVKSVTTKEINDALKTFK